MMMMMMMMMMMISSSLLGPTDGSNARSEDGGDDLQLGRHTLIFQRSRGKMRQTLLIPPPGGQTQKHTHIRRTVW